MQRSIWLRMSNGCVAVSLHKFTQGNSRQSSPADRPSLSCSFARRLVWSSPAGVASGVGGIVAAAAGCYTRVTRLDGRVAVGPALLSIFIGLLCIFLVFIIYTFKAFLVNRFPSSRSCCCCCCRCSLLDSHTTNYCQPRPLFIFIYFDFDSYVFFSFAFVLVVLWITWSRGLCFLGISYFRAKSSETAAQTTLALAVQKHCGPLYWQGRHLRQYDCRLLNHLINDTMPHTRLIQ